MSQKGIVFDNKHLITYLRLPNYHRLKKLYFLFLLILTPFISKATHLVGGEMTYTCLGDNLYEIRLVIYRDCGPTNTNGTGFDAIGDVAIYNSNNEQVQLIQISNPVSSTIGDETVGNDCLELPTGLCIEQGVYNFFVELPPIEGGYQIAYQRCCRNDQIINIDNPEDFGSTFTVHIPGSDEVNECNSSPTFNSSPPVALCLGDEINIDLSATDPDGDELVYELTTPLHGANDIDPTAITPPPFTSIVWETGYSETYPLDSQPPVEIDPATGIITGTPTMIGMFVIGIKVKEYRDGLLINEIIRDFRFLVVDCNVITASFPLSSWYCNSLTVEFSNNSDNADSYLWDFGENGNTSTLEEPIYTYADTGMYTVTLIAMPNTVCADTNTVTFPLYTELMPYFEDPEPQCLENNSFELTGEGIAPQGTTFNWNFGPNASPSNANTPNPTNITFDEVGVFPISYNLQYNDCDETYVGTIEVFDEELFPEIPNIESQCFLGNSFDLIAEGIYPANSNFLWEFGPNAVPSTSSEQNPNNIEFLSSGTQNITLTVYLNGCENATTGTIEVSEEIPVEIFATPNGCEPLTVLFQNSVNPIYHNFAWDLGNGETASSSTVQSTYFEGIYDVSLVVTNTLNDCEGALFLSDYIEVAPQPISDFSLNSDYYVLGDPIIISNNALHADAYNYQFSSGFTSNEEAPEYIPPTIGDIIIWQYAINEDFNCVDSSSVSIEVNNEYTLWTPNSFTPNGDQKNDGFAPISTGVEEYRLLVYDRWGKLIFDEIGESPIWDGNNANGVPCKTDSYSYIIDYKTLTDENHTTNGVVFLIR